MNKPKTTRRNSTLGERMTICVCCSHPLSHRHHLMGIATYGENRHTIQLCPNCHELFHLIQGGLVRKSRYCMKLLRQYTEARGMRDSTFQFLLAKVLEIEEIQQTFTWNTLQITEAVREPLARYVPMLNDINILGTFGVLKDANCVQFKVGAWVSEKALCGQVSESLWVFHFQGTNVTNVETLRVNRDADGLFVPLDAATEAQASTTAEFVKVK